MVLVLQVLPASHVFISFVLIKHVKAIAVTLLWQRRNWGSRGWVTCPRPHGWWCGSHTWARVTCFQSPFLTSKPTACLLRMETANISPWIFASFPRRTPATQTHFLIGKESLKSLCPAPILQIRTLKSKWVWELHLRSFIPSTGVLLPKKFFVPIISLQAGEVGNLSGTKVPSLALRDAGRDQGHRDWHFQATVNRPCLNLWRGISPVPVSPRGAPQTGHLISKTRPFQARPRGLFPDLPHLHLFVQRSNKQLHHQGGVRSQLGILYQRQDLIGNNSGWLIMASRGIRWVAVATEEGPFPCKLGHLTALSLVI